MDKIQNLTQVAARYEPVAEAAIQLLLETLLLLFGQRLLHGLLDVPYPFRLHQDSPLVLDWKPKRRKLQNLGKQLAVLTLRGLLLVLLLLTGGSNGVVAGIGVFLLSFLSPLTGRIGFDWDENDVEF